MSDRIGCQAFNYLILSVLGDRFFQLFYGLASKRKAKPNDVKRVVDLARGKYRHFNDHHLIEKLRDEEKIEMSREKMRQILRSHGIASPRKRRASESVYDRHEKLALLWLDKMSNRTFQIMADKQALLSEGEELAAFLCELEKEQAVKEIAGWDTGFPSLSAVLAGFSPAIIS